MIIAGLDHDELVAIERLKEKVQLARGSTDGVLSAAAIQRGLECVARFAQGLRSVPLDRVVVVGTAALRDAQNRDAFLEPAQRILRSRIRILSGEEEAELIFLGVSQAMAASAGDRLVIDIGGGSTEFCIGGSFAPRRSASINLGCVTLTNRWFGDVASLAKSYVDARRDASLLAAPLAESWRGAAQGARVIGTSGTIESVQSVLIANGFDSGSITREGVAELEHAIIERRWLTDLGVPGLAPERVDIFPAGLAALSAVLEALDISRIEFVDASLQHGLLYDLAARRAEENVQERTVEGWRRRFNVDRDQARRVRRLALALHAAVEVRWELGDADCRRLLGWAADLHEIGLMVSSRQPNRHGAYLVENGDFPGFTPEQRRAVALLIRGHRGGFPNFAFAAFSEPVAIRLKRLAVLLRLAVICERTRTDADSPAVTIAVREDAVDVALAAEWLADHALSRAELEWERERLATAGLVLTIDSSR